MKYMFLHISDLHYRANWYEENQLVCNKFIEDITIQIKSYENYYLVFSGDIVYEGANSIFYKDFETNFASKLDNTGLSKNRRICVPGNHDVSRDLLKPLLKIQKATLADITSEQLFNDDLLQNSQSFLASKCDNYKIDEC